MEGRVRQEGTGLLLMENLRDAKYVHLAYRILASQGERFAHVTEETLVTARKLTGLWASSPIAVNH